MGGSDDHILDLGLSLTKTPTHSHLKKQLPTPAAATRGSCYEPSLTLGLSGDITATPNKINHPPSSTPRYVPFNNHNNLVCRTTAPAPAAEEAANDTSAQLASPQYCNSASAVSSVSYYMTSHVKREREATVSDEVEVEKVESRGGGGGGGSDGDEEEEGNTRKKLRLTKDQSALLEESFKLHSTLNPKQKQALANQLNLRPRQVEVWFQNRRARTKLKQTEVDCEFLRKCCETLTEDNRRLQKELQELKAIKLAQPPFYMHLPAATLTMCPSCERVGSGGGGVGGTTGHAVGAAGGNSKLPFNTTAAKSHHPHHHHHHQFYNSYTNPSAAC